MNRTGIVATIGPVSNTAESIIALRDAGMSMARLNGSHADLDWHTATIKLLRDTVPDVPILLDIPGRKIRTIQLAHEPSFNRGDIIILTTSKDHDGHDKVPVNYDSLHKQLSDGDIILADDGTLRFTVDHVDGQDIHCRAETAGQLKSRKGINVPQVKLDTPLVTDRDRQMIKFAKDLGVDYVGISFVESAEHVDAIRKLCDGSTPRIVSKIENQGGLENMGAVIGATDAIMIDRGDLSVETDLQSVSINQKRILVEARASGKPVIVATEVLHSMIENPFPTKAEVSDITNAVLDGGSATMLSGETAMGKFPIEAVQVMQQVITTAEDYLQSTLDDSKAVKPTTKVPEAMEAAIAMICRQLPITKIIAITISGFAARMIASHQPRQPIIAVSNDVAAARSFNLLPGTTGEYVDITFPKDSTDHVMECLRILRERGRVTDDDLVLITAVGYPKSGTRMNLIQTHHVGDLVNTLKWDV